jgi:hypothetical protein
VQRNEPSCFALDLDAHVAFFCSRFADGADGASFQAFQSRRFTFLYRGWARSNDQANTLYYRESEQDIVIVSEPLDRDRRNWALYPRTVFWSRVLASGRAFCPSFITSNVEGALGYAADDVSCYRWDPSADDVATGTTRGKAIISKLSTAAN